MMQHVDLLIESAIFLVFLLMALFLAMYLRKRKAKRLLAENLAREEAIEKDKMSEFNHAVKVLNSKESSTKELYSAVAIILAKYRYVGDKLPIYQKMIFNVAKHKNTDKQLILKFEKVLLKANRNYKTEFSEATSLGLNAR